MKLLDEIVESLSSQTTPIVDVLLRVKVLLHKVAGQQQADWVTKELNGYPASDEIPAYRVLSAHVLVNMSNGSWQATAHPIPLGHLKKEMRDDLEVISMRQSLGVLEDLSGGKATGRLQSPIPMELNGILGARLANGYRIQKAWCEIQPADIGQILVAVRSRLLDFALQLQSEIGNAKDDEAIAKSAEIDTVGMFNQAVFDGPVVIQIGNSNSQVVDYSVGKNSFLSLADVLAKHNVSPEDIVNLQAAIEADAGSQEVKKKAFGGAVKSWMKGMLSKAIDASWQIEVAIAADLLTKALHNYYGWP